MRKRSIVRLAYLSTVVALVATGVTHLAPVATAAPAAAPPVTEGATQAPFRARPGTTRSRHS